MSIVCIIIRTRQYLKFVSTLPRGTDLSSERNRDVIIALEKQLEWWIFDAREQPMPKKARKRAELTQVTTYLYNAWVKH